MNNIEIGKEYVSKMLEKVGHLPLSSLKDYTIKDELPEQIHEINKFLPQVFQDESEKKYIEALYLALETSYRNGLYQFAYVQYHMLFMTSIYFVLLKIYMLHKEEMDKAIYYLLKERKSEFYSEENTKRGELYFGSFAIIGESDVFMLLRVIGLNDSILGELKKFVKSRNIYAHANGRLLLTSDNLFLDEIQQYNSKIEQIFDLLKDGIIKLYVETLTNSDFYDPEIRGYYDPDDQITQEFINIYSLTQTELNWLRKIKTSSFKEYDGYEHIKDLHIALCHYYNRMTGNDEDACPIEDSYLLYKYRDKADEFIERELGISGYECVKDGGEFPLYDCPDCDENQLVYDRETDKYHCFHCDSNFSGYEISFCSDCDRPMKNAESCICDACLKEKMEKD
ncbi:MAG: hypothetical protein IJ278_01995 [Clostridia bacterium]|nr:hypothetical protein [Clostridia bacterium]